MKWEYRTLESDGRLSDWALYTGPQRTKFGARTEISKLLGGATIAQIRGFRPGNRRIASLHLRLTPAQKRNLEEMAWLQEQTLTEFVVERLGLN